MRPLPCRHALGELQTLPLALFVEAVRKDAETSRSQHLVAAILEAALQVLEKEGAQRFTTTRVAERAGVSVGSVYQYFPNKASILFTGGPGTFGMDMIDAIGWMHNGGGLQLYQEFYKEQLKLNVVVFPILPSGPQAFGWFKRPIETLADMKGMKCRQTGIAGEIWQALGFTVVNMPGGEIIPSAQRGVIDCAEWVGGIEDMRLGFHNVWKYHYTPGVHENVTVGDNQAGVFHHSYDNAETVKRLITEFEVAPTGSAATIQLEYGDTDDLDTVASWTEIESQSHTASAKTIIATSSFTNSSIPANRLIRMNVDAVGSTEPGENLTVHLQTLRPLVAS